MDENRFRFLGRTGLKVGRLGVACSYGATTAAFEEAFEQGVNYFYWGSVRKVYMARAIRNIIANGKRDELVIVIQSYSRSAILMEQFYKQALKRLKIDSADILLLGWHNQPPSNRILDRALALRDKGMFRFLAVSGHQRPMFAQLADDLRFDLFHVRYNAAHRGAESDVFNRLELSAQSKQNAGRRKTAQRHGLLPFCHVTSSRGCLYVRTQKHRRDASGSQSLRAWPTVGR